MVRRICLFVVLVVLAAPAWAGHDLGLHWVKRDDRVEVLLIDQTGGRFPVTQAVHAWNGTGKIHIVMTDRCAPGRGCIHVRLREMRYLGVSTLYRDGRGHLSAVEVALSSTRRMSASKRLSVTCHEIGHALGLGHREASQSCLVNSSRFPPRPDEHDRAELASVYGHTH